MDPRNDEPFDRAPWRRLLGADSGAPTKNMDQRILAESRSALAPRVARWWLPASLAASVLFAIFLVQSQLADNKPPAHMTESDVFTAPASDAVAPAVPSPMIALPEFARQKAEIPPPDIAPQESRMTDQLEPRVDVDSKAIAVPAQEAPTPVTAMAPADSAPAEKASSETAARESAPAPVTAVTGRAVQVEAESPAAFGNLYAAKPSKNSQTPEQWYADIEALRKSGRIKEADAELIRFKSKYPDWLEHHQHPNP